MKSVSVRVSLEEKEASVLALALTLALFLYPERTKVATSLNKVMSNFSLPRNT